MPFLEAGCCSVHPGRPGACRLFGIPAVDRMNIPDLVTCSRQSGSKTDVFSSEDVKNWLRELVRINQRLFLLGEAPYFITGLTLECWSDIYYYEQWKQPLMRNLHDLLHTCVTLPQLPSEPYQPRTGIVEKVALIDYFFTIIDYGDADEMREVLLRIRDAFPFTGTWYYEEANRFLKEIEHMQVTQAASQ